MQIHSTNAKIAAVFYAESIKLLGRIEFNGIFLGNESVYRESHNYPLL